MEIRHPALVLLPYFIYQTFKEILGKSSIFFVFYDLIPVPYIFDNIFFQGGSTKMF
jgi:hypothetical protein